MGITARFLLKGELLLFTAISIAGLSGCRGSSGSVASDKETATYSRVVSLTPSITRSIYQLGAEDKLVGCSSYCDVEESDSIMVAGSVIGPDIEKIASLKPDLIILSDFVSENDVETLEKFGLRVELFRSPASFEEVCSQFIRLGQLTGRKKEAELIVGKAKDEVMLLSEIKGPKGDKPDIFMQIGVSPVFTVIPGTYMDDYITFSGAKNIAADLTNGIIGREFVVARNPDFIFIVTMGIAADSEKEQWSQFTRMNAVKQNNIHIIDSRIACEPTPENFIKTLRIITGCMEKERTK